MKKTVIMIMILLLVSGCFWKEKEQQDVAETLSSSPEEKTEVKEAYKEPLLVKNLSYTLLHAESKVLDIDGKRYTLKVLEIDDDSVKIRIDDKEYIGITKKSEIKLSENSYLKLNSIKELRTSDSRDMVRFYLEYNKKTIRDEVREGDTASYDLNGKTITVKPLVITDTEKVMFEINSFKISALKEDEDYYGKDFMITPTRFTLNEGGEVRIERSAEFSILIYG